MVVDIAILIWLEYDSTIVMFICSKTESAAEMSATRSIGLRVKHCIREIRCVENSFITKY